MANAIYDAYKSVVLTNATTPSGFTVPNWDTGDIRAILIDSADYTVDTANDQDLVQVAAAAREEVSGALANGNVSFSSGTATIDVDDFTFSGASGDQCEALLLYSHTGTDSTSLLLVYYDTFSSGMPVTLTGGDVNVTVNASGLWDWT
jgi:hypothetical protein